VHLTHREKHVLIVAAVIALILAIGSLLAPSKEAFTQFLRDWELVYLLVIVGPLGFYVASDPERRKVE